MPDYPNQQGQNRPAPVRHALNDFANRLVGTTRLEGAPRPPSIGFDIARGGISITANTNVQGDDDYGRIKAILPLAEVTRLFILLERASRMDPGSHEELVIAQNEYVPETHKREMRHRMTIRVGRDDAGVVYFEVASWKRTRPVVRLQMLPSTLFRRNSSKTPQIPLDKLSEETALAWARSMASLVPVAYGMQYIPPKERPVGGYQGQGQSQGQNPYRGNTNQGGNYPPRQSQAPAPAPASAPSQGSYAHDEFDDLPM